MRKGKRALCEAVKSGDIVTVQRIISSPQFMGLDERSRAVAIGNAVDVASFPGQPAIMKELLNATPPAYLQRVVDGTICSDWDGPMNIDAACSAGNAECVLMLLSYGATITNNSLAEGLSMNLPVAKALIDKLPPDEIKYFLTCPWYGPHHEKDGQTVLENVEECEQTDERDELIKFLLSMGATRRSVVDAPSMNVEVDEE